MKKTLLTFATAAMTMSSFAAPSTASGIDSSNISVTATPNSMFKNIVKDTSLSLATGFERTNVDTESTAGYLNAAVTKKFNEDISMTMQLRSESKDVTQMEKGAKPYHMIDPRIFINAFNTEFDSALGKITLAPQLRIQPHTVDKRQGDLANLRLGATAALQTSAANTLAFSFFGYDELTDRSANSKVREDSHFYFILADTYNMNDNNALTATFEYFTDIEQAESIYRGVNTQDDITLTYSNTSLENLNIAPYVSQDLKKVVATNMLELGVDLSYTF